VTDEQLTQQTAQMDPTGGSIPAVRLLRELGRGGMAVVFEGIDTGFNPPRPVAVKVMATQLSTDREFQLRFEREASLVADFRHDNVVRVYSSGEAGGAKYIVMEYLPGGTLAQRLLAGAMPMAEVMSVAAKLAGALAYSHSRGIVHRDFKPGNVLFTGDGNPVLSDFGVAKIVASDETSLTRYGLIIGAERYMAPEQARGELLTERADVYSFALTVFEMLTGQCPPAGQRMLRSAAEATGIQAQLQHVPRDVVLMICRCLLFDPNARPTARECATTLQLHVVNAPLVAARSRRLVLPIAAASVCAVAAVAAGTVWWPKHRAASQTTHRSATEVPATTQSVPVEIPASADITATAVQTVPVPAPESPAASNQSKQPAAQAPLVTRNPRPKPKDKPVAALKAPVNAAETVTAPAQEISGEQRSQPEPAATSASSGPTVSRFLVTPLQAAKAALGAGDADTAMARLQDADATPGIKSAFDQFIIEVMLIQVYKIRNDTVSLVPVLEAASQSQYARPADQQIWMKFAAQYYYQQKDYQRALGAAQLAQRYGANDSDTLGLIANASYFSKHRETAPAPDVPTARSPSFGAAPTPTTPANAQARVIFQPNIAEFYPEQARRLGQQGRAVVQFCITTTGFVDRPRIAASSGNMLLDAAALRAASAYRFQPATVGGRLTVTCPNLPIVFSLRGR
jgi:TonB family protein